MYDDDDNRKLISKVKIFALTGFKLKLPEDAIKIKDSEEFIDKKGNVYSFSRSNPQGIIKSLNYRFDKDGNKKYVQVQISVNGERKTKDIHSLLADAFIHPGYAKEGLCVAHKDNDKHNFSLENLSVVSYSKNNKDAYKDGLNKGNINGINKKMKYKQFLEKKAFNDVSAGFDIELDQLHDRLFDFQKTIVKWALARGRKGLGFELKSSYFELAKKNIHSATINQMVLFDDL